MSKMMWLIGSTIGGWLGWWLGSRFGLMTATILSAVGTGFGIYWARRFTADHF